MIRRTVQVEPVRQQLAPVVGGDTQSPLPAQGRVEAGARLVLGPRVDEVLVECGVRRRERDVARLALELPVPEELHLVLASRAAVGANNLLIRIRQHLMTDEVLRPPLRVTEVAGEAAD